MAVYDRWHRDPRDGDQPCKCGRGRNKLYPSADHLKGDRWQVRWRDPATGKQKKKNFALREGEDANRHADAFDKRTAAAILTRTYVDPTLAEVTLRDYGETWRKAQTHGASTAMIVESRLRNHVYEGEPGSGKTPKGGMAIGQHPIGLLASRPSMLAGWIAAMPLKEGARRMVVVAVSAILGTAVDDGIVSRNPLDSKSVSKPGRSDREAQPYTAAEIDAIAAHMDDRYRVMPRLGACTGMRQMEMSGLGADDVHRGGKRPRIRVARQLLAVDGELYFAPLKGGGRPRDVPLAAALDPVLKSHMERFPPVAATLPWYEPDSKLHGTMMTVRLVLTRPDGTPLTRGSSASAWETGVKRMLRGKVPGIRKGRRVPGWNIHRARHTYASVQLRDGVDIVRVAAWMGDTVQVVADTYAHLLRRDDDEDGRAAVDAFFASPRAGARGVPSEDAV